MKTLLAILMLTVSLSAQPLLYLDGEDDLSPLPFYAFRADRMELMTLPPVYGSWTLTLWVRQVDGPWGQVLLSDAKHAVTLQSVNTGGRFLNLGLTVYGVKDYAFNYRLPMNEWHHLAFVRNIDGTALYVDGILRDRLNVGFPLPLSVLGGNYTSRTIQNSKISADIDDLVVWRGSLTQPEIENLWIEGPSI